MDPTKGFLAIVIYKGKAIIIINREYDFHFLDFSHFHLVKCLVEFRQRFCINIAQLKKNLSCVFFIKVNVVYVLATLAAVK